MKTILFLLLSCLPVLGRDVTFAWDKNPEPDVVSYRVETASAPLQGGTQTWTAAGTTGATELALKDLPNKVLFVRVFAINEAGLESDPSEVLRVDPDRPGAPKGLRLKLTVKLSISG